LTDGWMKTRAKGQHRESDAPEARVTPLAGVPSPPQQPGPQQPGPPADLQSGTDVQQALQMLTLAQRTADEHVATAHREAERIQVEARAAAEQIVREAQNQAGAIRQEADTALTEARAQVERAGKEVQAQAEAARRNGEKLLTDARGQATEITKEAQANADQLQRLARQRYDEEVGNLAAKRQALQQQIEALQEFDRDYRSRLLSFMQGQLRALWVDAPQVDDTGHPLAAQLPTPRTPADQPAPTPRPSVEQSPQSGSTPATAAPARRA
jgi:cell division septum initiation protein DivIVA